MKSRDGQRRRGERGQHMVGVESADACGVFNDSVLQGDVAMVQQRRRACAVRRSKKSILADINMQREEVASTTSVGVGAGS